MAKKILMVLVVVAVSCMSLLAKEEPKYETVHYVTLQFKQTSLTLSLKQHIKDHCNAFTFTFPTTKKFYDSIKEGEEISGKFKTATFLLSGNIGKRTVIVEKKFTRQELVK